MKLLSRATFDKEEGRKEEMKKKGLTFMFAILIVLIFLEGPISVFFFLPSILVDDVSPIHRFWCMVHLSCY